MKLFRHYPFSSLGSPDIPVRSPACQTLLYTIKYVVSEAYFAWMWFTLFMQRLSISLSVKWGLRKTRKKALRFCSAPHTETYFFLWRQFYTWCVIMCIYFVHVRHKAIHTATANIKTLCLIWGSFALKMEAVPCSERMVLIYHTIQRHITRGGHFMCTSCSRLYLRC